MSKPWIKFPNLSEIPGLDNLSIQATGILAHAVLTLDGRSSGVVHYKYSRGVHVASAVHELSSAGVWTQLSRSTYRVCLDKSLINLISTVTDVDRYNRKRLTPTAEIEIDKTEPVAKPADAASSLAVGGGSSLEKAGSSAGSKKHFTVDEIDQLNSLIDQWNDEVDPLTKAQRATVVCRLREGPGFNSSGILNALNFLKKHPDKRFRNMAALADKNLLNGADLLAHYKISGYKPVAGKAYQDLGYPRSPVEIVNATDEQVRLGLAVRPIKAGDVKAGAPEIDWIRGELERQGI